MLFHSLNTVIISTLVWATFVAPSGGSPQNIVLGITRFSTSIGNTTLKRSYLTSTHIDWLASLLNLSVVMSWWLAASRKGQSCRPGCHRVLPVVVQVRVAVFPVVTHAENLQSQISGQSLHLFYCTSNLATCGYAPCSLSVKDSYSKADCLRKSFYCNIPSGEHFKRVIKF